MQLIIRPTTSEITRVEPGQRNVGTSFDIIAGRQIEQAINVSALPSDPDLDIAKRWNRDQLLSAVEHLIEDNAAETASRLDDTIAETIELNVATTIATEGKFDLAAARAEGMAACEPAGKAYERARTRRRAYEAQHVTNPEFARFYFGTLPKIFIGATAFEALIGTVILLSVSAIAGGIEAVLPAYAMVTAANYKLAGYLGRASFRWRFSKLGAKIKLSFAMTGSCVALGGMNTILGLLRSGLDLSPVSLKTVLSNVLEHLAGLSVTALGIMLVIFIATQSYRKLARGFTPEYQLLLANEALCAVALVAAKTMAMTQINAAYATACIDADDAAKDARGSVAEVTSARRAHSLGLLRLRSDIGRTAREARLRELAYGQLVKATWSKPDEVPAHYTEKPDLLPRSVYSLGFQIQAARQLRRHARQLAADLCNIETACNTAKKSFADLRDEAVAAIRAATASPPTP